MVKNIKPVIIVILGEIIVSIINIIIKAKHSNRILKEEFIALIKKVTS